MENVRAKNHAFVEGGQDYESVPIPIAIGMG